MGDILAGGLILALAGFAVALAAAETGDPYAQLGSSRAMTFGALIEPSVLFVVFRGERGMEVYERSPLAAQGPPPPCRSGRATGGSLLVTVARC